MKKFPVVMEAMTKVPDYYVHVACPVKSSIWLPQKRDRLIIIGSRRNFAWREPAAERAVTLREILEPEPEPHIPDYVGRRLAGEYPDRPIVSDPARGDTAPLTAYLSVSGWANEQLKLISHEGRTSALSKQTGLVGCSTFTV